jgi:hypothetical protein
VERSRPYRQITKIKELLTPALEDQERSNEFFKIQVTQDDESKTTRIYRATRLKLHLNKKTTSALILSDTTEQEANKKMRLL